MLKIYRPEFEDLWFREMMLGDEETMSYNHAWGGIVEFPAERWEGWFERWIAHPEGKRYYRYVCNEADGYIGEIAYHLDQETGHYMADVIVYAKHRRKGYGRQALELLCNAAKENGIEELYDAIAKDNPSVNLFLKEGFHVIDETDQTFLLYRKL